VIVRTDLSNAPEHFDIDALFGETGEKAADRMRCPTHRFRIAGPLAPSLRRSMAMTCACLVAFG
jgi:hypothetical protein